VGDLDELKVTRATGHMHHGLLLVVDAQKKLLVLSEVVLQEVLQTF